jgi:3-methylfumaryl-CoA hydratase
MSLEADQVRDLKSWIGTTETTVDQITPSNVRRIHATLDYPSMPVLTGDVFPRGWHSTVCVPLARQSEIGDDGHPKRGAFIPPIPFVRRMAASAQMTFHHDLLVGDDVRRESTIENIVSKKGRSGEIVFLTQKNELYSPRGLAVTERQEVAFRDVRVGRESPPPGERTSVSPEWERIVVADPVLVFRYAAIVFNGHRIHYDYLYSTKTESYADVMVSGGLSVMLLLDLIHRDVGGRLIRFSSRNLRPLYVNECLHVCGGFDGDEQHVRLWIADPNGVVSVTADAELETASGF